MNFIYIILFYLTLFVYSFIPECPEYNILALQKCNSSSLYSIHGLWPNYNNTNCNSSTSYPSFCENIDFSESMIEPIKPELDLYWYSCYGNSFSFWNHEIQKHYSCLVNRPTIIDYMNFTLKLFFNYSKNLPTQCLNEEECLIIV